MTALKQSACRHFLDLQDFDLGTLRAILDKGHAFKKGTGPVKPLAGKTLAMIFEKQSTRTRVSFEVAMTQLGGDVVILSDSDSQLGRGETVADTARVLSRYVDAIMIRTDDPAKLDDLVRYGSVPVINGLTDASHPCQLMADLMTMEEHLGEVKGKKVAWCGDGNNMAESWIQAAARFGFSLVLACPEDLAPKNGSLEKALAEGADVMVTQNPQAAVSGADVVVTDTWVSMGDTDGPRRMALLNPYQVNEALMALAKPTAIFMHCLPAHRGEEVTEAVIDGPQSVIWDEAENRLHAQKGVLAWCLA
ncbi:MAG: ornithine carbamoyltransferase [Rhodospirillales bacterium]